MPAKTPSRTRSDRSGKGPRPPRPAPWPTLRVALFGAILGAFLALALGFAAALGGRVTGIAFWGRIVLGALLGFLVVGALVALANRLRRSAR